VAYRVFHDGFGNTWEVWQVTPEFVDRRTDANPPLRSEDRREHQEPRFIKSLELKSGWLTFHSKLERRRLAPVPPEWESMSDAQLSELLARAKISGKTRRLIE